MKECCFSYMCVYSRGPQVHVRVICIPRMQALLQLQAAGLLASVIGIEIGIDQTTPSAPQYMYEIACFRLGCESRVASNTCMTIFYVDVYIGST